ncbi:MAG: hypothetical protein A2Z14_09015 [Chloroflexi bacterium RBG_16_48_8]|nr:MAG: hypothetical protein A2Z14_09015 [Chloroflexi bacterium RBG_16_48_8]
MTEVKPQRSKILLRPTLDTKFHIEYGWWDRENRDLEIYLRGHLCAKHQETFAELDANALVNNVDPETGEVTRVPGIQNVLITHCAQQPGYITRQTTMVNAVFKIFLANGNVPLTTREIGERLGRNPNLVLRTFSSPRVYKGIRPYLKD